MITKLVPESIGKEIRVYCSRDELLTALKKEAIIAEVGVSYGIFSKTIIATCSPKEFHLFDRVPLPEIPFTVKHLGDSSTEMKKMPDEFFDWIYIDGDHTLEGVKKDVEASIPKLKKDGLLVFNDYINFDYIAHMTYGVVDVVNDLCVNKGWEIIYFAFNHGGFHDIAIRRKEK